MQKQNNLNWKPFVFGGVSSCIAELVTFPIDTTKIRLQVQGQQTKVFLKENRYRGMFHTFISIAKEEGLHKFYRGFPAALMRQAVYGTLKLGIYHNLKKTFMNGPNDDTFINNVIMAMAAGAISSAIASPTDRIKIRMQSHGQVYKYNGVFHAFKTIFQTEGLKGLYHGVGPTSQRAAIVAGVELPVYDKAKKTLIKYDLPDNINTHFIASFITGFCSCVISNPIDVVKSRIMNEAKTNQEVYYRGTIDCLHKTVKLEGFAALYRGFWPTFLRQAPWNITFFITYEHFKKVSGL